MYSDSPLEISPRPEADAALAKSIARELFDVSGEVTELGSQQDRNFRIRTEANSVVLKIANQSWRRENLEAQNAALTHIAAQDHDFHSPVPYAAIDGSLMREIEIGDSRHFVRLISYVHGPQLSGPGYLAPVVITDLGRLAGRTALALKDFDHLGLVGGQWDLMRGMSLVEQLAPSIPNPTDRAHVIAAATTAAARIERVANQLRIQTIHGDVTDDNVVAVPDHTRRLRPNGVIDFGDLTRSWLIGELAVTCSSVLRHRPDNPMSVIDAIRAFHALVPLLDADVEALWPLIVMRGAVLVSAGEHQSQLDPDNPLATEPLDGERLIFTVADSVPCELAEATIRAALGWDRPTRYDAAYAAIRTAAPLLPGLPAPSPVDLSSTSSLLDDGRFLRPTIEIDVLADALRYSATASTRYAEARLTRTTADSAKAPATIALGVDLAVPVGTALAAPWDLQVVGASDDSLTLASAAGLLRLRGVSGAPAIGSVHAAGSQIGTVTSGHLHAQLMVDSSLDSPEFADPHTAPGWLALSPDPSPLFGCDLTAPHDDVEGLLQRRDASFANLQEYYYESPMQIERGWRHHLIDTTARSYVDMVNNVAVVGHGHPRLADAVDRQMRKLNTNSRFHFAAVAEFSERLAALATDELDTVFLVNSGSEAVDLALRIAQTVTDRIDLIAVREAYHGWTMLSDAVTTSLYDNPRALETRPEWIHLASSPNPYRGTWRGPDAAAGYIDEFTQLVADMSAQGRPPAAFICEPVFGNAGGVLLPDGYLAATFAAVRGAGGLCIADEVQVGYGRLGHYWWAYEMHDVRPDIVTIAKAMGNGHPLGAVITTRAIAEAFAAQGSFFSSAGGSPVSCVVGTTVLDIIEDEGLQRNAAEIGDHLIARCTDLMLRYPIVGAVHGMGLYLGVELVRSRESREPATAECQAICDRLRELGIIVQPTGERANVLKMKPPMCLSRASADFYVDQLEEVLRSGW